MRRESRQRGTRSLRTRSFGRPAALLAAAALIVGACTDSGSTSSGDDLFADPGDCTVVPITTSPEEHSLITELALEFNDEAIEVDDRCIFAIPRSRKASETVSLLVGGWDEERDGAAPVLWAPASTTAVTSLRHELADRGRAPMVDDAPVLMRTPLVIALPEPMARALGWPDDPPGWNELAGLAVDEAGWETFGHPEWGRLRLAHTHPDSTTGLATLISQFHAARGDAGAGEAGGPGGPSTALSTSELYSPGIGAWLGALQSSVVHYGNDAQVFMENWYRADQRGDPTSYLSAAIIDEQQVIAYNQGVLDPNRMDDDEPNPPRIPLVAIYPADATVVSESPLHILDAPWVSDSERRGAQRFIDHLLAPEQQGRLMDAGFRPGNPDVALTAPIDASKGVDPDQPDEAVALPDAAVLAELTDRWAMHRRPTRLLLAVDVSASMSETVDDDDELSHLDLLRDSLLESIDELRPTDEVGLWVFASGLGIDADQSMLELVPVGPLAVQREALRAALHQLPVGEQRNFSEAATRSVAAMAESHDPARINAVVLFSDGYDDQATAEQLDAAIVAIDQRTRSEPTRPVLGFTVGLRSDAELGALRRLSIATDATTYNATDPSSIDAVTHSVMNNF